MDKRNKFKSPKSISVKEICSVQDDFNSRFSAIERTYSYVIYNSKEKPLFFKDFCCWVSNNLDIKKMNDQLAMFIGENDFSSFRSVNCNSKNPVKTMQDVNIKQHNKFIILSFTANAFLQNMVRIMVGTLIDISKNENPLSVKEILEKRNRAFAGRTAPAKGLFFLGPKYNDNIDINTYEKDLLRRLKT